MHVNDRQCCTLCLGCFPIDCVAVFCPPYCPAGCILHELLTGRPPFVASDPLELIHQHLARAPPAILPRLLTASTQPALFPVLKATQAILHKMLQKEAEER